MKLVDLMEEVNLQGEIKLAELNEYGDTINSYNISNVSCLSTADVIERLSYAEVKFMYAVDGVGMVIEVEQIE